MIIAWCHLDGKIGNDLSEIGGELNVIYICWWHCGTQWNLGGVYGRIMLSIWQIEEAYMTGYLYKGEFCQRWQVMWLVIRCLPDWCKLARYYESSCSNQSKKITTVSWHGRLLQKVQQNLDKTKSLLCTNPLLKAPDFDNSLGLAVDVNDHNTVSLQMMTMLDIHV